MNLSKLNSKQVGTYAEYLVKMEFTKHGAYVFGSEVDDQGIDFVIRTVSSGEVRHYDIQVKSLRSPSSYVFITEKKFCNTSMFYVALVLFAKDDRQPDFFLIPSSAWEPNTDVYKFYTRTKEANHKTASEYGINISQKNWAELEQFRFKKTVELL
jgi:hypothetical protein